MARPTASCDVITARNMSAVHYRPGRRGEASGWTISKPGKPQQNAYIERYNRTVRYDWLGQYLFSSITEVQDFATRWLWTYNHERPNMGLGGITPKQKLALAA